MTRDRARKQAARNRAAVTGERYVVARREAGRPAPRGGGALHELTHRVPGVPAHVDGGLQVRMRRSAPRARGARPGHPNALKHHEPRVLVGWQNRIARFFGTT